jgi:hypothetical protein
LLSRDFVKLILISIFIASPLGWYVMNQWLQNFGYKIDMEWWSRFAHYGHCVADCQLPVHQGGADEPGYFFEK